MLISGWQNTGQSTPPYELSYRGTGNRKRRQPLVVRVAAGVSHSRLGHIPGPRLERRRTAGPPFADPSGARLLYLDSPGEREREFEVRIATSLGGVPRSRRWNNRPRRSTPRPPAASIPA